MVTMEDKFKNKKPNYEKLAAFGFQEADGVYTYRCLIAGGRLQMTAAVTRAGGVHTSVTDLESGGEYVLHRAAGASGSFVGMVRAGYDDVLAKIAEECFEPDVFQSACAQRVISHIRDTYGDELEFLWSRFPNNAVWRRKDTGKWYGALLVLPRRKLGLDSDDMVEILDLRMKTEEMEAVIDHQKYFPGYHMNKKHWCTICLDGSVPVEEIVPRIEESYRLAVS